MEMEIIELELDDCEIVNLELTDFDEPTQPMNTAANAPPDGDFTLAVAVVYEERLTQEWARRVCIRLGDLVGKEAVRSGWWPLSSLRDPRALDEATKAASTADVIVVSVRATEEPAPNLSAWIDMWLSRRAQSAGALVALISLSEPLIRGVNPLRDYLRTVASRGGLDFLPHQQKLPSDNGGGDQKPVAATVASGVSLQPPAEETPCSRYWGINE